MYLIHRKQVIIGHERVVPSNLLTASPKKKKKKKYMLRNIAAKNIAVFGYISHHLKKQ